MFRKIFLAILITHLIACQPPTKKEAENKERTWEVTDQQEWLKNEGLLNVEAVAYDSKEQIFYASNGMVYQPGINGFISKFSANGSQLELTWVDSLSRPTGMVIESEILYVADVNRLVSINTRDGVIVNTYKEPIENSGLNDVCIDANGNVYVSASAIHAVLKLSNGKLEVWAQDENKLAWTNGLTTDENFIVVAGLNLSQIHLESREITLIETDPPVNDFEGIAKDGFGGYYLTTVENSSLYHLDKNGKMLQLVADGDYFGDFVFNLADQRLIVPRGNHEKRQFFITAFKVN